MLNLNICGDLIIVFKVFQGFEDMDFEFLHDVSIAACYSVLSRLLVIAAEYLYYIISCETNVNTV